MTAATVPFLSRMTLVQVYYEVEGSSGVYRSLERLGVDIRPALIGESGEALLDRACDAAIGAASRVRLTARTFENAPNLRLCAGYTIGYDNVDVEAASRRGVLVTNNPREANWGSVAETTVAHMLAHLKKLRERDEAVRSGRWDEDDALLGRYVGARQSDGTKGLSIGIIGFGRVGRRIAELMRPWRAQLLAVDPAVADEELRSLDVAPASFDAIIATCDVVIICCDLNPSTDGLIGQRQFEQMKPGAILLNPSRSRIVHQDSLLTALNGERLGGASLDVYETEPLPEDSPFRRVPSRHLLSPHMFGMSEGSALKDSASVVEGRVLAALAGEVPSDVVNPEAIDLWSSRYLRLGLIQPRRVGPS